jgi:GTPase
VTGPIVAIDGPAGSGKSTLAERLARALGLPYLNTGLMYRALTHSALREELDLHDGEALAQRALHMRFDLDSRIGPPRLVIDGQPPSEGLVSPEVEVNVSKVSSHPQVRTVLREEQRRLGGDGAVVEGRDIGSVVFPDADVKIFLEAAPRERAARRVRERAGSDGQERPRVRSEDVATALAARDQLDERVNPFVPAPDAVPVDTTGKDPDAVFQDAMAIVGSSLGRIPSVAVVGRQNVGKSTLVNRLLGRREVIAHETPGVTRDRVEIEADWGGRRFRVVDTGGFATRPRGIAAAVSRQAERAAGTADLVLLVVDGQAGVAEEDAFLARRLQKARAPVLVAVNKVDSEREEPAAAEFFALGLGEPVSVSALHGRGAGELLDRVVDLLPPAGIQAERTEPRFAIVGRPNVGKSSLFNRLVGEERSVVFEDAGTTRDAVDAVVTWPGGPMRFVDTAGFRRPSRVEGVEYYSFLRTERAIERAEVALLVLDASQGLTAEDRRIAARVIEAGRGLAVAANKWDLVREKDRTFRELAREVEVFAMAPLARVSALTGAGVSRLPSTLRSLGERWNTRVPTSEVNRVIEEAQGERPPPGGLRYRYTTQVSAGPPTFVVFGSRAPESSYVRYLEGRLRRAFGFEGVPIRLRFRAKQRGGRPGRGRGSAGG